MHSTGGSPGACKTINVASPPTLATSKMPVLPKKGPYKQRWRLWETCHHMLDELDEAVACVGRALELAPGLEHAVTLLHELLA